MLRPTEAATFGMARTTAVPDGSARDSAARVRPAAMERMTLPSIKGSSSARSLSTSPGLTATTMTDGGAGKSGASPAAMP
jgi:hypothetical protein